jgi:hypothetical protein
MVHDIGHKSGEIEVGEGLEEEEHKGDTHDQREGFEVSE